MFNNAAHALMWAYNTASIPIAKMSGINKMRQAPYRGQANYLLLNLSLYDLHGQAGQIIGMVEKLDDPAEQEYLAAKFGRRLGPDDLEIVVYRGCAALGFSLDKTEAVYRIMRGYFDGRLSHREARRILGCRDQYAVMVRRCLYDTLDIIHDRAMADIGEVFRQHGLIESCSPSVSSQF